MPKEFTHWSIAEKVRRSRWTARDRISQIIVEFPNLYLLGAMAHDSLFYPVFMPKSAGYAEASKNIHIEDITGPFRSPSQRYGELFTPPAMAFLAGAATHIVIDGIFHPFVYYFSGDSRSADPAVSKNATARHRTLETYLDLHFLGSVKLPNRGSMLALLRDKELGDDSFYELASRFYGNDIDYKLARTAMHAHANVVYMAQNQYCVSLVNVLNTAAANSFKAVRGLCYPNCKHFDSPFFANPFIYKNPVNGEEKQVTVADLEQRAEALINSIFDSFSRLLENGGTGDIIDTYPLEVLHKDAAAVEKQHMTHFDLSRDIETMLSAKQVILPK